MTNQKNNPNRGLPWAPPFVAVATFFVLAVSGCAPQPAPDTREADVAAIREADLAWSKAQGSKGLEGTMSFYLDDGIKLAPNRPMAIGKDAIREASEAIGLGSPSFSATWQPTKIEVARSGDIGYAIGNLEGTSVDAAGNHVPVRGKYVEIWKKQYGGSWMLAADMFSSDLPADVPSMD